MKHTIIPLAALALISGAGAAQAFTGSGWLANLNVELTDQERTALEEARTIREEAETKARDVLQKAGIDDSKMGEIHRAMHEARREEHDAMIAAVEARDYAAFTTAVAGSPIATTIDTEEEFNKFVEAHELMQSGDREGARKIMEELGLPGRGKGFGMGMGGGMGHHGGFGRRDRDDT